MRPGSRAVSVPSAAHARHLVACRQMLADIDVLVFVVQQSIA